MKTKIMFDDEYTTVKKTNIRTTVIRHYTDIPDVITYLANDVGDRFVRDLIESDNDPCGIPFMP